VALSSRVIVTPVKTTKVPQMASVRHMAKMALKAPAITTRVLK
jgi:hypothetical protein